MLVKASYAGVSCDFLFVHRAFWFGCRSVWVIFENFWYRVKRHEKENMAELMTDDVLHISIHLSIQIQGGQKILQAQEFSKLTWRCKICRSLIVIRHHRSLASTWLISCWTAATLFHMHSNNFGCHATDKNVRSGYDESSPQRHTHTHSLSNLCKALAYDMDFSIQNMYKCEHSYDWLFWWQEKKWCCDVSNIPAEIVNKPQPMDILYCQMSDVFNHPK